ncbi:MAG TPA: UvrD-helicase domain-containing protein [Geobacteraceae bacterium]|nr:UvrD-helicase domain-containing protein [Geobacteraceae bacterium]
MNFLSSLNKEQRQAVVHTEGPLLVLAGAGSGKTRVITCRIAYLLLHQGVRPENILAVTFTNKAAREMGERLEELVGKAQREGVIVSTFHSLGVRILRQECRLLGYRPNFSIFDSSDQLGLIRQTMREVGADPKKITPETVHWKISMLKNALVRPADFQPRFSDEVDLLVARVYPRYQSQLKACNAIDFDDIILLTVRLLQEHPEVLARWQERFRYLMVDEYQDTNPSQYLFISLLAAGSRNLCVVGDDDQSIYGWRGADVRKILAFEEDYAGCRVIKLEQNYRCSGNILMAANQVIRNNPTRKEKTLWTDSGPGGPIDLVVMADEEEEATTVVERIQTERFRRDAPYRDFCILYRTNAQSRAFEEQLRYEGIPYVLVGGMRFYDRKEVKDTLSWLKVLANPDDEQALLRIINFPRRGIGDSSVGKVNDWSMAEKAPLFQALGRVDEVPGIMPAARQKIFAFHQLLKSESELFADGRRLADKARELFTKLKIEEELMASTDDRTAARRKVENVEQIVNSLASFEERTTGATLSGFLERLALLDEDHDNRDKREHEQDAVTLMSLHSSKGLEFPHVFLVGLEEDILPHRRSIYEDMSVDEERRLMYVGITRAKKHLTITRCLMRRKYGRNEERVPSRFLGEIPDELLSHQQGASAQVVTAEDNDKMADNAFARLKAMLGE